MTWPCRGCRQFAHNVKDGFFDGLPIPLVQEEIHNFREADLSVLIYGESVRFGETMNWSWIDLNFPWIGCAASIILLVLLFITNRLRSDLLRSRLRDRVWLSWLAVAIYLIHNVEEYGIDLLGQSHAFPPSMCATLGQQAYPLCPIPPAFFLAVNLPLFWVGAPIAALMSRRHPILGLSFYGIIFINGLAHIGALARVGYNPGALTAAVLFIPISIWVARVCFGKDALPYAGLLLIVADGVILHVILIGSAILFLHGVIGPSALTTIQVLNAVFFFLIAWWGERWRGGKLIRLEGPVQFAC